MVACAPSKRNPGDDDGDDDQPPTEPDANDTNNGFVDASIVPDANMSLIDAGNVYPDAGGGDNDGGCAATECPTPNPTGCSTAEVCNNGSDDNCDGRVDEGCACSAGTVQPCFASPPGYRHQGACMDGQQTCEGAGEFTHWGACTGGITPHPEACDSVDNDCNGCVDDNPLCCEVDLQCPTSMPEGSPFTDYVINGVQFYMGTVTNWKWEVTGGPCDVLLAPNVSYTLNGTATTVVQGAALSTLHFRPTLSGDYTVHVTMTLPDGTKYECTFIVHIAGPGFRVELCWDTTGADDIDLHVHKPGTTTPWFGSILDTNNDDCYYMNCKASGDINWSYANSPLAECVGGPEGPQWQSLGYCRNPRLDIDNIVTVGKPENVNIDRPENNKTYRVAVHHYGRSSGTGQSHPMVNIYCGGHLKATYGKAPDTVAGFSLTGFSGGFATGPMWRVADVTPQVNAAGDTTDCALTQIHPAGMTSGYNVTCPNNGGCVNNAY